jgi:hypothetical protein
MVTREFDFRGGARKARGPMNALIASLFSEQIRDPRVGGSPGGMPPGAVDRCGGRRSTALFRTPRWEKVMKKTLVAISVAALLGTAGVALADEAKGKIQAVDPTAKTITLEDGTTYTLAEGVMIESLQPGTEVTVSFEDKDGTKTASSVTPAQ